MKVVGRRELVDEVYQKFNGVISRLSLYDALQVICEDLTQRVINDQSVSIHNFGTFHKYKFDSRKTVNIHTGDLRNTRSFINIQFIPTKTFTDLINQKKTFFNNND